MAEQSIEMATWESAFAQWEAFECDGSCNNGSDVCAHVFVWNCPKCGKVLSAIGEDMDLKSFHKGLCEPCEYAPEAHNCIGKSCCCEDDLPF